MTRKPKRKPPASPARRESSPEPYPSHPAPSPAQCLAVRDALLAFHGFPDEFAPFRILRLGRSPEDNGDPPPAVLDGLVTTLLSQNTTDAISRRAFASLKAVFPSWDQVVDEEGKRLEDAIRCGGLAATKAARIRAMLRGVRERRGKFCLEYLRELSVDEVKRELTRFKGIGPKTVACVLMFYLQKDDFPVDTHVLRITKALGWVPATASRVKAYVHLNNKIPDDLKFDLNCLFVTHGKLCQSCTKKLGSQKTKGSNSACSLASYCLKKRRNNSQGIVYGCWDFGKRCHNLPTTLMVKGLTCCGAFICKYPHLVAISGSDPHHVLLLGSFHLYDFRLDILHVNSF